MMNTKDSLIDWANGQGAWAQYLLSKCFENNIISNDDIEVFVSSIENNAIEQSHKYLLTQLPSQKVVLKTLKAIQGVNKLMENQTMSFCPNINVIYGTNGSGKTGYVRVIKQIGTSLDKNATILSNLDSDHRDDFTSTIVYLENDVEKTAVITSTNKTKLNVKIFNHDCVSFSLKDKKNVLFQPREFEYFNILSAATTELYNAVIKRIATLSSNIALLGLVNGTNSFTAINKLIASGNIMEFDDFCLAYYDTCENITLKIAACNQRIKDLNVELLISKLSKLNQVYNSINDFLTRFLVKSGVYSTSFWNDIFSLNKSRNRLLSETINISDIISDIDCDEQNKEKLKTMLLALDKYISSFSKAFSDLQECCVCHQLITDDKTKELFVSYDNFIKKDNTDKILKLDKDLVQKQKLIDTFLHDCNTTVTLLKAFDYDKNGITNLRDYLLSNRELSNITDSIDFSPFRTEIEKELKSIEKKISDLKVSLSNNDDIKAKELNTINELHSLAILLENKSDLKNWCCSISLLSKYNNINNSSLSALQKKILISNYQSTYITALTSNLKILRAPKNLNFQTQIKASSLGLKQTYSTTTENLNDVLSEGEQTVVSLAHFITESSLQEDDNVLIFDDPVNSLDLDRMDVVARALVNLSFNKQIIIFTHNLVFLNAINSHVKKLDQTTSQFYCVHSDENSTGILKDGLPNTEKYKYYRNKANELYQRHQNTSISELELKHGYSLIRSAVELLVVDNVFNGTVNRFEPEIHMGNFERIKYNEFNQNFARIIALFDKCCEYTEAHSSSEHRSIQPSFLKYKEDFDELEAIYKIFK